MYVGYPHFGLTVKFSTSAGSVDLFSSNLRDAVPVVITVDTQPERSVDFTAPFHPVLRDKTYLGPFYGLMIFRTIFAGFFRSSTLLAVLDTHTFFTLFELNLSTHGDDAVVVVVVFSIL